MCACCRMQDVGVDDIQVGCGRGELWYDCVGKQAAWPRDAIGRTCRGTVPANAHRSRRLVLLSWVAEMRDRLPYKCLMQGWLWLA